MEDGQLDECTLTFRDIGNICMAFETVLQGVFHERIEYPHVDLNRARRNSQKAEEKKEQKAAQKAGPQANRKAQPAAAGSKPQAGTMAEAKHDA